MEIGQKAVASILQECAQSPNVREERETKELDDCKTDTSVLK